MTLLHGVHHGALVPIGARARHRCLVGAPVTDPRSGSTASVERWFSPWPCPAGAFASALLSSLGSTAMHRVVQRGRIRLSPAPGSDRVRDFDPRRALQRPLAARLITALTAPMPLLLTGRGFRQELERCGALALFAPLEGGAETRLLRRLRAAGYQALMTSARGLGDPETYLLQLHGVRPPHLGHQSVGRSAAVGEVQQVMPQLGALLASDRPIVLWLLEGQVLSSAERGSLVALCRREPKLRIVVEMGGARALRWQPLQDLVAAA